MSTLRIGMDIQEFVSQFKNHPVLFIGSGFSLRYLKNSFNWNELLQHVCYELTENKEMYLDIKSKNYINGEYKYEEIATEIEKIFNEKLQKDRDGKFKEINDIFYENMNNEINLSRFKIYITKLLKDKIIRNDKQSELNELLKVRKNIGSIITTNYGTLVEKIFEFEPLVGNNILLSNPYGSVYKIHGCISSPEDIIITKEDYKLFEYKYDLIRAQLLSLFIHNPIIFLGYSVSDSNIQKILKTIFSYVSSNTELSKKIRDNFLLVEYEENSTSEAIVEHDIRIDENVTIRINKIKTDNYTTIYKTLSELILPVSAMDIRKVQKAWNEIRAGGNIEVSIIDNLDELKNNQMILAVGSRDNIKYEYQPAKEMMQNYFEILDKSNEKLIELLNKQTINASQYFPIYAFSKICYKLERVQKYKKQQVKKINEYFNGIGSGNYQKNHSNILDIFLDD
ncbi:SIR2 family protein [Xenorhabdus sp. PB62.4]|uniref:SIR2 family protein n=1 Tax=Xenorhabdus sp. PB62.4 TaxID=1851573 RepID=UPI0021080FF9|nr:SIR2 family protein [Xenorhabdus sp. PB62.4]MBC8955054.1 SIR2 family protein [Xenorhabdus sp. PB62.4]